MNINDSDVSNTVKNLEKKVEALKNLLNRKPEILESNMLDSQLSFLFDISEIIEDTWKSWQENKGEDHSSNFLISGFSELRDRLGQYSLEYLQWPKVVPEKQNPHEFTPFLPGVKILDVEGKFKVEIATEKSQNLTVHYRYCDKNIEPLSVVVIRELCTFAIKLEVPSHTVHRRTKLEDIFKSREFKDRLMEVLGNYPKIGKNEKDRILDIVSNHIGSKCPEVF